MKTEKDNRGGAGRGQGRKPTILKRVKMSISVSDEAGQLLAELPNGNKSSFISDAIIEKYNRDRLL